MKITYTSKLMAPALLLVAISAWACSAISGKEAIKPANKEIALQLYSVQSDMKKDPRGTLNKVARLGFAAVETADYKDGKFYGLTPEEFRSEVEKAGMIVLSSHVVKTLSQKEVRSGDFSDSMRWWDKAVSDHKRAGMKYIVMAWAPFPADISVLDAYCKYFEQIGKKCRDAGIKFGYHNHYKDFYPEKSLGGKAKNSLEYILLKTDPNLVFVQIDTHNAVMGGGAPAEFIRSFPGRFKLLHIKDKYVLGESGMVGFDAVFKSAKTGGAEGFILEQEGESSNSYADIAKSLSYLQNAPFVPSRSE